MIETKPRINCGNRGQLFRATWLYQSEAGSTPASLTIQGQVTKDTTVKWSTTPP